MFSPRSAALVFLALFRAYILPRTEPPEPASGNDLRVTRSPRLDLDVMFLRSRWLSWLLRRAAHAACFSQRLSRRAPAEARCNTGALLDASSPLWCASGRGSDLHELDGFSGVSILRASPFTVRCCRKTQKSRKLETRDSQLLRCTAVMRPWS